MFQSGKLPPYQQNNHLHNPMHSSYVHLLINTAIKDRSLKKSSFAGLKTQETTKSGFKITNLKPARSYAEIEKPIKKWALDEKVLLDKE
jgi:hypothetical protein